MPSEELVPSIFWYADFPSKPGELLIKNSEELKNLMPSAASMQGNWSQISSKMAKTAKHPEIGILNNVALHELIDKLEKDIASCNNKLENLTIAFNERPVIKHTTLFDIDSSLTVLLPIPITIEEQDDEVIASFPEIELFAVAENEPNAINNLKAAIKELFIELSEIPDNELGKIPLGWKRVLDRVLKK